MYDRVPVHGSFINHVNVILDEMTVHQHTPHVYHAYHVLVVHHGSLPLAVKTIFVHSFADKLRLYAVGATLFRVYTAVCDTDSFHRLSLTLARIVVVVGSLDADRLYVYPDVHAHRLDQFVLNAYGVVWSHIPAPSHVHDIDNIHAIDSFHELFANVNVGAVISTLIVLHVVALYHH